MKCSIEWNNLSLEEWDKKYESIRRASLLQSYDYAIATYASKGQKPLWGLIKIDGEEAGIVQFAETSLFYKFLHTITLHMGPLWFNNNNLIEKTHVFFEEFDRLFPKRFGRKRRIIPNIKDSTCTLDHLHFCKHPSSYETIWLDLEPEIQEIRKDFKQKWRNQLNKSEKYPIHFTEINKKNDLDVFTISYQNDFNSKNYKNIHPRNLPLYIKAFRDRQNLLIYSAHYDNTPVAYALILIHGCCATYQIGLVNECGRQISANYGLLWNVIKQLKDKGIKDFDLGGINAYDAKNIEHFKKGMNGEKIKYVGIYS